MTDADAYRSLLDGPEVEVRVRGSRFLGRAFAVAAREEAAARVEAVRRAHHAATHHAWAYRVGRPGAAEERFDDDGEPAGTAGRPILGVLEGRTTRDALVVVTRYFGGVKLGTGGLARAYADAAARALDAAPVRTVVLETRLRVACAFDDLGAVEAVLAREAGAVLGVERAFDPAPRLEVRVRRSTAPRISDRIVEATAGRARVGVEAS